MAPNMERHYFSYQPGIAKAMVNILHLNTTKDWRGGDMQMLTTYQLLRQYKDLQQTIFCASDSKIAQQLRSQQIPFASTLEKRKISFQFVRSIARLHKTQKFDVLHAHDSYALNVALTLSVLCPEIKVVYSRKRDNRLRSNFIKQLKFNNRRLRKIVCVSKAVANIFSGILKNESKLSVIYDGIDVDYFASQADQKLLHHEYGLADDVKIIGNIAALKPEKDLKTFIDAAGLVLGSGQQNLVFLIVGEGPRQQELLDYVAKKGLQRNVLFSGFRKDIPQILPEFACLMMSSLSEGLPLTIFEAFACKVPVVATAAGGIAEVITQRETGMISPIGDAEALAKNLLDIINDQPLQAKVTANAYKLVNERFSLDAMRQNYYQLYRSLA